MLRQAGRQAGGMHTGWQPGKAVQLQGWLGMQGSGQTGEVHVKARMGAWSRMNAAAMLADEPQSEGSAEIVPDVVHACHSEAELHHGSSHPVYVWLSMQQGSCQQLTLRLLSSWRSIPRALNLEVLLASPRYSRASMTRLSPCKHGGKENPIKS